MANYAYNYGYLNGAGFHAGMGTASAGGPGWPAGTQIHYHNTGLLHNSFSGYSDSAIQAAIQASGLFAPGSVLVTTHASGFLGLGGSDIDIIGVVPVAVSQIDASNVIENLMPNWFVRNPATASWLPAPSIQIGSGIDTSLIPTTSVVTDPSVYGIESIITDPNNPDSDFDVIFTDGTSAVYNSDAVLYIGQTRGIAEIGEYGPDDIATGIYATMNDGAELYFNLDGSFNSFVPSSAPGANMPAAIVNKIALLPPASQPKGKDWNAVLNSFGLGSLPVALGVGAGTVVLVGGIMLYLFATGSLKPGR